jgi:hypothetical protein
MVKPAKRLFSHDSLTYNFIFKVTSWMVHGVLPLGTYLGAIYRAPTDH